MIKAEHDCETGKVTMVEMPPEEVAAIEAGWAAEAAARKPEPVDRIAALEARIAALEGKL